MDIYEPNFVVVFFIENRDKKYLFIRRPSSETDLPNIWALPSEHKNPGETVKETVIRGGKEELGITIANFTLLDAYKEQEEKPSTYLVHILPDQYLGDLKINPKEVEQALWMKLKDFYDRFEDDEIGPTLKRIRGKEF